MESFKAHKQGHKAAQQRVQIQQDTGGAQKAHHADQQVPGQPGCQFSGFRHIPGEGSQQLAGFGIIKESKGQGLQMPEQLLPQVIFQLGAEEPSPIGNPKQYQKVQQINQSQPYTPAQHRRPGRLRQLRMEDLPDPQGKHQFQGSPCGSAQHQKKGQFPVPGKIVEESAKVRALPGCTAPWHHEISR